MADEAFALSPISARATQPREEDYAAISEAFMETSRGRWFLTEYAKRNRNADTRMVLDAVERIEASLAKQREESSQREEDIAAQNLAADLAAQQQAAAEAAAAAATAAETRLAETLAAIRAAVETVQASAIAALDDQLALEPKLAPIRKGARVIREISWRLREIGNDGRICDLIDSQVSAIESGAAQFSSDEAKAALDAAFATIAGRLAEFDAADAPAVDEAHAALPAAAVAEAAPASKPFEQPDAIEQPETDVEPRLESARSDPDAVLEPVAIEPEAAEIEASDDAAADAHDEAVLDIIAAEMGAPQPFELDEPARAESDEAPVPEEFPVEQPVVTPAPVLPMMTMASQPIAAPERIEAPIRMVGETPPMAPVEMSLGSSLLASGIVKKPVAASSDPLAPIRRMSQAEKIAFFS